MIFKLEDKLIEILNYYSKEEKLEEKLGNKLLYIKEKISNSREDIVPVLGMQGMGKSTLINSILAENILPNEADETTCVPVEVKYGEEKKAEVYFFNSDKKEIVHTIDELREYVDNNYNHGNKKNVEKITLFRPLDILKSGLVIVDLPGVGSLTKNNENTTNRYIKNLSCALFVIPTVPTIRRHEEAFIRPIWEVFANVIFVQNDWGENEREIKDSVDFNTKVLKNISEKIKTPFNDDIIVVNAYDAAYGRIYKDEEKIKSSNIQTLLKKLETFSNENKIKSEEIYNDRVSSYVEHIKREINNLIFAFNETDEELKHRLELEENNFKRQNKDIDNKIEEIIDYLSKAKREVNKFADEISEEYRGTFRAQMYNLIDGGLVDGEDLNKAFEDYQEKYYIEISEKTLDKFDEIKSAIGKKIKELSDIISSDDYRTNFNNVNFNKDKKFKWEKALEISVKIGGAVGGYYAGAAITGAVAGAMTGAAAGPIGIAVGIVAGTIISITASFIGSKSNKVVLNKRKEETKSELSKCFNEFKDNINTIIVDNFKEMSKGIEKHLEKYSELRKYELKNKKVENEYMIKKNFKQEYDINKLRSDFDYLESYRI